MSRPHIAAGAIIVLVFVLAGVFAGAIARHDPVRTDLMNAYLPPSGENWFGTDDLGRDIFARVVWGARISLIEGFVSVALAMLIGIPIGILAGYLGGVVDAIIMRLIDIMLAFPGVLLAIVVVSILGPDLLNAIIAVGLYAVPVFARLARADTMAAKGELYVEACRALGMSHTRILRAHILPSIAGTLMTMAALRVAIAILTTSGLSFLGLGAQPPIPEWGAMLANGRDALLVAPYVALFPAGAIILLVLGLNLLQDGVQHALDPRARQQ